MAASGGGTRAAIYTAAVLRGLALQEGICNVVLASWVSGGSAALAYFAVNEDTLRVPLDRFDPAAWKAFDEAMSKAYILEVVGAASDTAAGFGSWTRRQEVCGEHAEVPDERSGGWLPARVRFGYLLAESFVCEMSRAHREAGHDPGSFGRMDQVDFGLILDTGLAGQFPAPHPRPRLHRGRAGAARAGQARPPLGRRRREADPHQPARPRRPPAHVGDRGHPRPPIYHHQRPGDVGGPRRRPQRQLPPRSSLTPRSTSAARTATCATE